MALLGQLSRAYMMHMDLDRAIQVADRVLAMAERADLVALVADTLVTKGTSLGSLGRGYEGLGVLETGMHLAEQHGLAVTVGRARLNRGFLLSPGDPREALANDRLGLAEARRLGQRTWSDVFLTNAAVGARWTGDWDWALGELDELLAGDLERETRISALTMTIQIRALRGGSVAELLAEAERLAGDALDRQVLTGVLGSRAATILVRGELLPAAEAYRRAAALNPGSTQDYIDLAARAAIRAGDAASAAADLAAIEATGARGPAIDARRAAIQAGLAALDGRGADAIVPVPRRQSALPGRRAVARRGPHGDRDGHAPGSRGSGGPGGRGRRARDLRATPRPAVPRAARGSGGAFDPC